MRRFSKYLVFGVLLTLPASIASVAPSGILAPLVNYCCWLGGVNCGACHTTGCCLVGCFSGDCDLTCILGC